MWVCYLGVWHCFLTILLKTNWDTAQSLWWSSRTGLWHKRALELAVLWNEDMASSVKFLSKHIPYAGFALAWGIWTHDRQTPTQTSRWRMLAREKGWWQTDSRFRCRPYVGTCADLGNVTRSVNKQGFSLLEAQSILFYVVLNSSFAITSFVSRRLSDL